MGGLVLDYYVVFLFKLIARVIQTWGCSHWPMTTAAVEIADPDYGGTIYPTAQVIYSYVVDGATFEGSSRKPFIRYKSAKEYTCHFPNGSRGRRSSKTGSAFNIHDSQSGSGSVETQIAATLPPNRRFR
jgi:hypothetical protein